MANEADLVINFESMHKSSELEAVSDVSINDFSALSLLMFKHGS